MKIGLQLTLALVCIALAPAFARAQDLQRQMQLQRQQELQRQLERQNQEACMGDAMAFCGQFIPDRERVAACLIYNRMRISQPCRQALTHWHG
jgi:hypothetical protein